MMMREDCEKGWDYARIARFYGKCRPSANSLRQSILSNN
jgi:hypothetical protein